MSGGEKQPQTTDNHPPTHTNKHKYVPNTLKQNFNKSSMCKASPCCFVTILYTLWELRKTWQLVGVRPSFKMLWVETELLHFRVACIHSNSSKCSQKQKSLVPDDLWLKRLSFKDVFFELSMWRLMLLATWGNAGKVRKVADAIFTHTNWELSNRNV